MNKIHVLYIVLIAILFSACSSLVSVRETQQNAGTAKSNDQSVKASTQKALAEKTDAELNNAFAHLDEEPTDNVTPRSVPQQRKVVCPIPDQPCRHKEKEFADWELSFRLPAKITPNKIYSSEPFYAVVLKTYNSDEDCDGGEFIEALENERREFQNLQLERKVFASYSCPNMDAVGYDFEGKKDASGDRNLIDHFIAVYAGETEEDAEVLRRTVRDEYPKAFVKRMTANWERIEQ